MLSPHLYEMKKYVKYISSYFLALPNSFYLKEKCYLEFLFKSVPKRWCIWLDLLIFSKAKWLFGWKFKAGNYSIYYNGLVMISKIKMSSKFKWQDIGKGSIYGFLWEKCSYHVTAKKDSTALKSSWFLFVLILNFGMWILFPHVVLLPSCLKIIPFSLDPLPALKNLILQ